MQLTWWSNKKFFADCKSLIKQAPDLLDHGLSASCSAKMEEMIKRCEQRKKIQDKQFWWIYAMACCFYEQSFSRFGKKSKPQYLQKALEIAQQNDFTDVAFWVNKTKLNYLSLCGRRDQVQEIQDLISGYLQKLPEPSSYEIHVLPALAWEDLNQGRFNSAQDSATRLLKLAEKLGAINLQVRARVLLAGVSAYTLNRVEEALPHLEQAVSIGKEQKVEQLIPALYYTAGVLLRKDKLAKAKEYLQEAWQTLETQSELSDSYYHIHLFNLEALLAQKENNFEKTESYYKQAIKMAQALENPLEEGRSQLNLGKFCLEVNDFEQAAKALEEASAKFIIIDNQFRLAQTNQSRQTLKQIKKKSESLKSTQASVRSSEQQIEILDEFMRLVVGNLDLDAVLSSVIEYIMKVTAADRGFLILLDEAGKLYSQIIRMKEKINQKQNLLFKNFSRTITEQVIETQKSILLADVQEDSRFATAQSVVGLDIRSVICVPLKTEKMGPVGLIYIDRQSLVNAFDAGDLASVESLAEYASIALVNARLHNGVQKKLKSTEVQLIQSEKMATVGILAGGVAHEINTPLGAILLNAEMLLRKLEPGPQRKMLEQIEQGTQRCKEIIDMLLQYARKTNTAFEEIDLNQVIDRTAVLLGRQLMQDNIQLVKQQGKLVLIEGNSNELMQVFTNLIVNAKEAIRSVKKTGTLTIKTFQQDNFVVAQVKDDGSGIPKENLGKIFDPFFTTKDIGKGTGLGLAIVYRIIENHNGTIEASSEPKAGSIFTIKIPMKQKGSAANK